MLRQKLDHLLSKLYSAVPCYIWAYFTNTFVRSLTSGNWPTVMVLLCGLALIYFIILQSTVNLYSLLLHVERGNRTYVFFNWTSQSIEKLSNNTFPFPLGQIKYVF